MLTIGVIVLGVADLRRAAEYPTVWMTPLASPLRLAEAVGVLSLATDLAKGRDTA